jgi:hypothetical protein
MGSAQKLIVSFQCAGKSENLTIQQQDIEDGIRNKIEESGLTIAPYPPWTAADSTERFQEIAGCHGILILAFGQWRADRLRADGKKIVAVRNGLKQTLPSEFVHIGITFAIIKRKPLLLIREKTVAARGALRRGYVPETVDLPNKLGIDWLNSFQFANAFANWVSLVKKSKHIFLGYSTQASDVAVRIRTMIEARLKLRVFDWRRDFIPSESIWDSIARAEQTTTCGVFLFMEDDEIKSGKNELRAPRDNVIYEAGYFAGAKGRSKTIIIHEKSAKLPTDLDGIIHIPLESRNKIGDVEKALAAHLKGLAFQPA